MRSRLLLTTALISVCFAACDNDTYTTTPAPSTGGSTASTARFSWQEDGGSTMEADSMFWVSGSNAAAIQAYRGGISNSFVINFTNSSTGSYALGSGVTLVKNGANMTSKSATLNIQSNTNNKLTGSGIASLLGGSVSTVTFKFTDIPKR